MRGYHLELTARPWVLATVILLALSAPHPGSASDAGVEPALLPIPALATDPISVLGPPLGAFGRSATAIPPAELARDSGKATLRAASRYPALLPAGLDAEQLAIAATHSAPRLTYVHLRQTRDGLPVLGSRITFQWRNEGTVSRLSGAFASGEPISSRAPALENSEARALALDPFGPGSNPEWLLAEEAWAPLAAGEETDWKRIWRFQVVVEAGFYEIWIDSHTGELLALEKLTAFEEISGRIEGEIEPRAPGDVPETVPFRDARITLQGPDSARIVHAGESGEFFFSDLPSGSYSLISELVTPAIRIRDRTDGNRVPADSIDVAPGAIAIQWNDQNSRLALRDAFAHANEAYRFVRTLDSGAALAPLDEGIEVWVDDPGLRCNALWDGTRLKFYEAGTGCRATARIADVVFHEYGHAVTYHVYRPFNVPRDMNEAFSDYFAATLTGDPRLGLGLFGTDTFVRELEVDRIWPDDANLDPHLQGLILGGALWDLRSRVGAEVCDPLFHFARYGLSTDFDDYLLDLLAYDDDDGDLSNGCPHFDDIIGAFRAHGIGDYAVRIEASPIPDVEDLSGPIRAEARIHSLLGLDPDSLVLFYRLAGETEFQRSALSALGGRRFEGSIPPPPPGSDVEYYWAAADTSSNRATLPSDAPETFFTFAAGPDLIPPVLEHLPLSAVAAEQRALRVEARVRDNTGLIESVELNAHDGGAGEWRVPLLLDPDSAGDLYAGDLPIEVATGDTLWYSISATDRAAIPNVTTYPAQGELAIVVREGRFLGLDLDDGGLRGDGEWEWGLPEDVPAPGRVWATRLSGDYGNSARSVLEWGPIDISGHGSALLEFEQLYEFIQNSDGGRIEASNDGRTWRVLVPAAGYPSASVAAFEGSAFTGSSQGWTRAQFALDRVLGNQLWIRWVFASDALATDLGWYIDDVSLIAAQARIAPHSLRATSGEDREIPLSWSAPRGIDLDAPAFLGYRIERAASQEEFQFLASTRETSYLDREVENDVTYRYHIHASYSEGLSPAAEISATPAAPQMQFAVRSVSYTLRGVSAADTTFFVQNVGQGTLHFDTYIGETGWTIDDARIDFEVPRAGDPELIVREDPVDSPGNPDLARIAILHQTGPEADLRIRLQGHFPWGDPNLAWGGICLLDTDGNVGTRPESFGFGWNEDLNIGWEYAVVFGSLARELGAQTPALLYDASRPDQSIRLDRVEFPKEGREISFGIPMATIGAPERMQIAVLLSRSRQTEPFERAPELPDVPWLTREPRHGRARVGQPSPFSLEFDARSIGSGEFAAQAFVTTNDPTEREFAIPITLQVRDVIPNEPPFYQFASENTGVRILLTLPIEPPADGALIERLDTKDRVWSTVSSALPPDEEGKISYLDASAVPGAEYEYRFRVRFSNGQIVVYGPYLFDFDLPLPRRLELTIHGANPFRDSIPLRLGLPGPANVRVGVFDISGRRVRLLMTGALPAGIHPLEWDGRKEDRSRAAAGIYWVRADTGAESRTIRLVYFP